jgi:hypothetical protein
LVAAAVQIAWGPNGSRSALRDPSTSVCWWIKEWKVERLVDALKLSRASGIPIEKFTSEIVDLHPEKKSDSRDTK